MRLHWAYEVYDTDEHPVLFQNPRDAFAAGMAIGGSRVHRMIPYDENFQILTLPTGATRFCEMGKQGRQGKRKK